MSKREQKLRKAPTKKSAMFFLTLALIITSLLYLFTLLWFLLSAFKPGTELFAYPLNIFPENPTVQNFIDAWTTLDFFRYFSNTLISAVTTTVLTIIASAACGYAFAKYDAKWLSFFFICINDLVYVDCWFLGFFA